MSPVESVGVSEFSLLLSSTSAGVDGFLIATRLS